MPARSNSSQRHPGNGRGRIAPRMRAGRSARQPLPVGHWHASRVTAYRGVGQRPTSSDVSDIRIAAVVQDVSRLIQFIAKSNPTSTAFSGEKSPTSDQSQPIQSIRNWLLVSANGDGPRRKSHLASAVHEMHTRPPIPHQEYWVRFTHQLPNPEGFTQVTVFRNLNPQKRTARNRLQKRFVVQR